MKLPSKQNSSDVVMDDLNVFNESFVKRIIDINEMNNKQPIIIGVITYHLSFFLFEVGSFDFKFKRFRLFKGI